MLYSQNKEYNLKLDLDKELTNKMLKPYLNFYGDSIEIIEKLNEFKNDFQDQGYLAVSIDSLNFVKDEATATIHVGKKYIWQKLNLTNLEPQAQEYFSKKQKNKPDTYVNIRDLSSVKSNLVSFYNDRGYPFVKVAFSDFNIEDSTVNAILKVVKGQFYLIDTIIIKGGVKISQNYISKVTDIEKGDFFNQSKFNEIDKNIENISFLSEVKPAEIEFKQNNIDLYLYLKKRKANMFNGIVGFLPDDEGKLLITGELTLNLLNSFARGEEILLKWEKLESSTQKLNIGFSYPYIFKSNFGIDFDFELYKKDSTYLNLNSGLGIRWFVSNNEYIKAYYRYKSTTQIAKDKSKISSNYADVKSNLFGLSYYLSNVDYRFNPRKGIIVDMYAGTGFKSIINTQETDSLNIDDKSIEIDLGLDFDVYFPIYRNFVFHFGNKTRYLDQFVDSEKEKLLFENELYRFGGANSLRGFDESIFLASIYSIQNIEVKYLFDKNSSFYAFWNGAYYYQKISSGLTEDFPWGFGVGLSFDTNSGIFSLSYALGKQFDNPFLVKTAKIHFGYISRF